MVFLLRTSLLDLAKISLALPEISAEGQMARPDEFTRGGTTRHQTWLIGGIHISDSGRPTARARYVPDRTATKVIDGHSWAAEDAA